MDNASELRAYFKWETGSKREANKILWTVGEKEEFPSNCKRL